MAENKNSEKKTTREIPVISLKRTNAVGTTINDNIEERLQDQRKKLNPRKKKSSDDWIKVFVSFILFGSIISVMIVQALRSLHVIG